MNSLQNPFNRDTGWYEILPRKEKGLFGKRQIAFWERKFDKSYGEWSYQNGDVRAVSERLKDDLVLKITGEKV